MSCVSQAFVCYCAVQGEHELTETGKELHECECGGQWTGSDQTRDMVPHRFPQRYPDGSPVLIPGLSYEAVEGLLIEGLIECLLIEELLEELLR